MDGAADIAILWEGDGLIVVDKPPGLPSTGRDLDDPRCVQHVLMTRLRRRIWAVHQLDTDTSGVNLFVRRKALVDVWSRRLREGTKRYVAICHGSPDFDALRVDAPLGPLRGDRRHLGIAPRGRPAVTELTVLDRAASAALVEARILTGRTHQVRLHLSHLGHPLVGERRYREPACDLHPRHALHAAEITVAGSEGQGGVWRAPFPADLAALCARLGLGPARK